LINIMFVLFQEKPSGFPLGWNVKYGDVQRDGRQYSTGLFSCGCRQLSFKFNL
jgi:hypothetical protein